MAGKLAQIKEKISYRIRDLAYHKGQYCPESTSYVSLETWFDKITRHIKIIFNLIDLYSILICLKCILYKMQSHLPKINKLWQ